MTDRSKTLPRLDRSVKRAKNVIISTTRERILNTAAELWHARSYDGVGVAEVCAEAGVQKGSFFHFFRSKEDLLLAVLDLRREQMREHMLEPAFRADVPPLQRIQRYFDLMGQHADAAIAAGGMRGCPFGNLASELATRSDAVRERVAAVFDETRATLRKTLREAAKAGDLPMDSDVSAMAAALVTYMQGLAVIGKTYNDPRLLRRLGAQAFSLLGLRGAPTK
ncbi:MAG: TetR/AcrR family transcriptional regulator [Planctomycetota bacterium]